ncbi:uncharacterized protein TM35_000051620 [Trypanosoma theileri]|uniref:PH-like domain-containing protein n=1 Tax=Trypanosoma theileri TaxID=67003 RepID=A0A1X0P3S1_9TRYP|nr:uncharacterized protein TM35_000051620 [Trypanosoma theileri]ORC91566.1 hypothetical protein TM35_000051620 [Trypanosoma theileri]
MRRGEERSSYSAFVPKLSINRSSESFHDPTSSDPSENERRFPFTSGDPSRGWRANVSSLDNSGRNHNRNSDTYDQSSPTPINTNRYRGVQSMETDNKMRYKARVTESDDDMQEQSHYFKTSGYSNRNSNMNNMNMRSRNVKPNDNNTAPYLSHVNESFSDVNNQRKSGSFSYDNNKRSGFTPVYVHRVRRSEAEQYAQGDLADSSLDDSSSQSSSIGTTSSGRESVLFDMDAEPVVPVELMSTSKTEFFDWMRHPRHVIIVSLLRSRGLLASRYANLVEYHMSELFLHYIDLCFQGAYFVRYQLKSSPKERFFAVRMLPRNTVSRNSEKIPYLVWTLHRTGVQVVGCVPLEQLVGITINTQSASFRPHLLSSQFITGPRVNNHRLRLPIDGAFSLWFYDRHQRTTMSLDLLTCNPTVLDVWTKAFKGFVSVNSSSVVQMPLTSEGLSAELDELSRQAQGQLASNT